MYDYYIRMWLHSGKGGGHFDSIVTWTKSFKNHNKAPNYSEKWKCLPQMKALTLGTIYWIKWSNQALNRPQ